MGTNKSNTDAIAFQFMHDSDLEGITTFDYEFEVHLPFVCFTGGIDVMEKNIPVKKYAVPKAVKIVLIVLAGLAVIYLGYYFYAVHISFDYKNATAPISSNSANFNGYELGEDFNDYLSGKGYKIEAPFFGNKLLKGSGEGFGYTVPVLLDDLSYTKVCDAYNVINDPIYDYVKGLSEKCNALGRVGYTVEQSAGILTVHFSGELYNADGSVSENVDKSLVFDVKNASILNVPKLIG